MFQAGIRSSTLQCGHLGSSTSHPLQASLSHSCSSVCLPWSLQANCSDVDAARLMSKLLTMNSRYNGWYRATFIAIWHARQAIPKRSHRYI